MSDVTPTNKATDVAGTHPALKNMVQELENVAVSDDAGVDDYVLDIMDSILSAESFEDIFSSQTSGMVAGKNFVDTPFVIERTADIRWRKASQRYIDQGAFPYYAIFTATALDGARVTVNCGGSTFVAVLWALQKRGFFDQAEPQPMIIHSVTASSGNEYLQLLPYRLAR